MSLNLWRRWLSGLRGGSIIRNRRCTARPRLELLEDRWLPSTVSWVNPASGFWDQGSNWSNGIGPQTSDDVVINQPNNITVTFQTGKTVDEALAEAAQVKVVAAFSGDGEARCVVVHVTIQASGETFQAMVHPKSGKR